MIAVGHLLSTSTFDLLAWTSLSWLLVKALRPVWRPARRAATPTIAVGLDRVSLDGLFASVTPVAQIDNGVGVDTAEQGRTVWISREQRLPWSQAWPRLRYPG